MIDVLASKAKMTPKILKKMGLASIYRLIQEPTRLFKRQMYIYSFWVKFFPTLLYNSIFNKEFSIPNYFLKDENK